MQQRLYEVAVAQNNEIQRFGDENIFFKLKSIPFNTHFLKDVLMMEH